MKNLKWMLAVLTAVLITAPVFAQAPKSSARTAQEGLSASIERAAVKAVRQHQKKVCCYCGEEILYPGQHCSASGYVSLCSAEKYQPAKRTDSTPSVCPKCGKAYTIDEKYHGAKHVCQVKDAQEEQAPVCCRCGEEILSKGQHCAASGYVSLCTTQEYQPAKRTDSVPSVCPKCGKAYTIDEKYHGAKHVCQAENTQEEQAPVCCRCGEETLSQGQHCQATGCTSLCTTQEYQPAKRTDSVPSVCPKCGKAYTIDEKYHGAKHVCKTAQKDTVEYCIYCGEPIVENNQKCTVAKGMDCRVRCPECTANLRDPKNVNAAGTHYCRFKLVIKPVKPHTGK